MEPDQLKRYHKNFSSDMGEDFKAICEIVSMQLLSRLMHVSRILTPRSTGGVPLPQLNRESDQSNKMQQA